MRSFLVFEKGGQLLIRSLEKELLGFKMTIKKLTETVQLRNKYIEELKTENRQIKEMNLKLLKT